MSFQGLYGLGAQGVRTFKVRSLRGLPSLKTLAYSQGVSASKLLSCDPGNFLDPLEPQKVESAFKETPKRVSDSQVTTKVAFWFQQFQKVTFGVVYFLSSLRPQTAKTLICTESGVSADSRKSAKKCRKQHFLHKKCAKSPVFRTFWHSFWNRRKPHILCRLMFLPFGV